MYPNPRNNETRVNERIRISPVLVIDDIGANLGSMNVANAIALARSKGLDLIEVQPNIRPPVCRIGDYGKFKYEKALKERANRKNSKAAEMKEIRLRPVTAEHDLEIKMKAARGFLEDGHAVTLRLKFDKRELQFKDRGIALIKQVTEGLADISTVKMPPSLQGKFMTCILTKKCAVK